MAEYIKRESAIDAVLDVFYDTTDIDLSGEKLEAAILNIQAADVAPVRHGRWIEPMTDDPLLECLACPDFVDKAQDDLEEFYRRDENESNQ